MADTLNTTQKAFNILVVEDSPTQLEKLRSLLEESGFSVVAATNGKEGLAAAQANPIDLVISDIVMPEMDGYALCKALREDETCRRLPVILLTSLTDPKDVIQGLESGANNFICKPYDDRGLVARVQNVLTNQEIRRTTSSEMGLSVFFAGQPFFITADRLQILDLLLSTYEVAIQQNRELLSAREELRSQNAILEKKVRERTANLMAEMAERARTEQTLRESQARYRAVAQSASLAIVTANSAGNIVDWNPNAETTFGHTAAEVIGRPLTLLIPERYRELHLADMRRLQLGGESKTTGLGVDLEGRRKDSSEFPIELSVGTWKTGEDWFVTAMIADITERKRLEAQFLQAQKMEVVGQLASGIAHDFNNLLTVINGTADLVLTGLKEGAPLRTDLQDIRQAGERAASLTRQLLAFSRKQIMKFEALDLSKLVADIQGMLRRLIGENIALVMAPAKEVGCVMADSAQIEQVVMNLTVNARDAMLNGGTLTIETRDVALDEAYAEEHPSVQPGPHVMLAISDTGTGMDEATRRRIFEPFFTTKGPGTGTGLGLSTVYGIVKQSGGSIWVYSEPGMGTTFKIYLPRVERVVHKIQPAPAVKSVRGTETILLVEDEEAVRHLAQRVLQKAGYTVLIASNGPEALLVLERHDGPVHLVLTDMVMPGMSGRELAARIKDLSLRMKVLFTSGYTDEAILHHGLLDPAFYFIGKPYTVAELTHKVREVLES